MSVQPTPRLNAADLAAFDAARESIVACPSCGFDGCADTYKFCPDCGVRLADTREAEDE